MIRTMLHCRLILLIGLFLAASQPAVALFGQGSDEKGPAFTEPPQGDQNFSLMGEYVGHVKTLKQRNELLGLQIRPVGNDQFDAVAFRGGLPGQAKHRPSPIRMIGKRSGQVVVLSGGPWAIFVEPKICRLIDFQGKQVGQLKRIRRRSPTLFAAPPEGGIVLFDGTDTQQFSIARMTDDGLLMEGAQLNPMFQDFDLHLEFRLPYMPQADGQKRANSGLYLQSRYECQVLDSFAQTPKIDGCGALYRMKAPDLNMCLPPLVWQTYDVQFTAPRWNAEGSKIRAAHISSWINGKKVQDDVALPSKTGAGKPEGPFLSPIKFQDHGDPVRFRNIWAVDRGLSKREFPIKTTKAEVQAAVRLQRKKKKQRALEAKQRAIESRKEASKKAKAANLSAKLRSESKEDNNEEIAPVVGTNQGSQSESSNQKL